MEEGEAVAQDRGTLASAEEVVGAEERASWWKCSLDQGIVSEVTLDVTKVVRCHASYCLKSQGVVVVKTKKSPFLEIFVRKPRMVHLRAPITVVVLLTDLLHLRK